MDASTFAISERCGRTISKAKPQTHKERARNVLSILRSRCRAGTELLQSLRCEVEYGRQGSQISRSETRAVCKRDGGNVYLWPFGNRRARGCYEIGARFRRGANSRFDAVVVSADVRA